jgi:hypothetical protein
LTLEGTCPGKQPTQVNVELEQLLLVVQVELKLHNLSLQHARFLLSFDV